MSSPWTAPGQSDPAAGSAPGPTAPGTEPAAWDAPGAGGSAGPAPTGTAPGAPGPSGGPRRELVRTDHLFPLRPLNLGEILGAALRIYRVNPRAVLGVAAIVYAIATLLSTLASGMSLVPMIGEMQVMLDDPTGDYVGDPLMGGVSTIISSVVSGLLTLVAAALVTVALTRVTMDAAVGRPFAAAQMWQTMRRKGLAAVGMSLLISLVSLLVLVLAVGVAMVPLLLDASFSIWWVVLALGTVGLGLLGMLYIWMRTVLAIPALVIEDLGMFGALRRSLQLSAGKRQWRILGIALLVFVLATIASQVISSVFGTIAFVLYMAILLLSGFEAFVLGIAVMTLLSMLGAYVGGLLVAPFISAAYVALYADIRMRHEAWDVQLQRESRQTWHGTSDPDGVAR